MEKIKRVHGYQCALALPNPLGNAVTFITRRDALIVCVETESGVKGWGEAWAFPAAAAAVAKGGLVQSLIGRDVHSPVPLWHQMMGMLGYDRRGISHMAVSALDMAIWDASARAQSVPLFSKMGGAIRRAVRAYATGPFLRQGSDPYAGFVEEVETYAKANFKVVKLRLGRDITQAEKIVRTLRNTFKDNIAFAADFNQGLSLLDARDADSRLAEHRLLWIEEPIPYDDLEGYRSLAASMRTPLAGGESLFGLEASKQFLQAHALHIFQPDIALCGGVTEALRIATLANAFNVPVTPHVWGTGVNLFASLQYAAMLPGTRLRNLEFPFVEIDVTFNPLRSLIGEVTLNADGEVEIPDGPGIGVDVSMDHLAPYITEHWVIENR